MSDKTLKRLVLGQMGLLAVLAAVLVWVIFPDGASFAWRGFYQPQNPATLEGGIQLPIAIRTEESRPDRGQGPQASSGPGIVLEPRSGSGPDPTPVADPGTTPIIIEDFLIPEPTPVLPVIQPDSSGVGGIDFDTMDVEDRRRLLDLVGRGSGSNFGIDLGPSMAKILSEKLDQNPSREFTAEERDWLERYLSEQAKLPWLDPDPEPRSWEETMREQNRRRERERYEAELREQERRIDCLAEASGRPQTEYSFLLPSSHC